MPTASSRGAQPAPRRPIPSWAWVLLAVTALDVATYVVWTVPGVRPSLTYDRFFDGWVNLAGYALLAAVALLGAGLRTRSDLAWWLTAAGLALRAVGFAIVIGYLLSGSTPPYPSLGDLAFVLSSIALVLAVVCRLRGLAPRLPLLVLLDGVAAALLVLGVAIAVLSRPLATLSQPGVTHRAVVVNAAYPVLDMALLVALATLVTTVARHLHRSDLLLVVGLVAYVAVDVIYLVQLTEGTWRPGTWVASASMVATALIAVSVWAAPAPRRRRRMLGEQAPTISHPTTMLPTVFVVGGLIGMAEAGLARWPFESVLAFAAATAVAAGRLVATCRVERAERDRMLRLSSIDLHRYRALVEASTDYVGMADLDGRLLYLNPAGRRMLGLSPHTPIGELQVVDTVPLSDEEVRRRLDRVIEHGSWYGEIELQPLGGEPIPVEGSTFTVRDPVSGEPFALATVQRDISPRLATEAALRDLAQQRARLLSRLVQAQEDERSRIAADVHDDSVQALAAVDLRLGLLRTRLARRDPELAADLAPELDKVVSTVSGATTRLRNLLFDLESPARRTTLAVSLGEAADFVFGGTDVAWTVEGDTAIDLPEHHRVTAYRIAKEAMVNARKHADADAVTITITRTDEHVVVSVRDDGRGIDPAEVRDRPGHLGIGAMRDRASIAGGVLEVSAHPEGGTEVRLTLRA